MSPRRLIGRFLARRRFKGIAAMMSRNLRFGGHVAGAIDACRDGMVRGWVYDATRPAGPVALEVLIDGAVVATGRADQERPDLALLLGDDGRHGFAIETGALWLPATASRSVSVRLAEKPIYVIGPLEVPPDDRWLEPPEATAARMMSLPLHDLPRSSLSGVGRFADIPLPDALEERIFLARLDGALSAKTDAQSRHSS